MKIASNWCMPMMSKTERLRGWKEPEGMKANGEEWNREDDLPGQDIAADIAKQTAEADAWAPSRSRWRPMPRKQRPKQRRRKPKRRRRRSNPAVRQ
ncbi:hypothetical protein [Xanthomonas oryzae]|uniref:hypothetical protein n=1 Tax=Xanthomonas oryzae TaxID=347 RepID=UPI001058596D|nr:hypothetical protein [Xanthomonas oryzae]